MCATDWWSWRSVPQRVLPASADTVPKAIRNARNRVFDRDYGPGSNRSDAGQPVETTEGIPIGKMDAVAVIRFADYKTIRSASAKSIYTEVRMNVEQVLRDPYFYSPIQPGKDLTVILPGGSLRLPSGQIIRNNLGEGIESGIQPGHRYVAFLGRETDGDFFGCGKTWDLSGGVAVATSARAQFVKDIAISGPRPVDGMAESEFIAAVKDTLAALSK